ncbi:5'-AMP-activated protein kinase catalytic subunit alpha-1-like [Ochotona princeps]|uniref:5'-AMP-activated protein kinase catalytic subunit alpha-1-like n=1 Tax=Ochotona princeps TaxID=9978 RepID=UPI0027151982|nr:5'-AMP-activated protein kinase catalytic subunit alpha-1-like [Ochotona princeps]
MYTTWSFHPPLPGYDFTEIIGQGGYGVVKLARQLATGRDVAVKIFLRERRGTASHSVAREASMLRSLRHDHIVNLLDEKCLGRFVFLVMELASRGTLHRYVWERGGLEELEARSLFAQILSAVDYCHASRVAHRDLKPGNILLDTNMNVKLADFGLSRRLPEGAWVRGFYGTPEYCAPEMFSGEDYDAFQADMWSLGVTLFGMLTATLPFTGATAGELQNRIMAGHYVLPRPFSLGLTDLLGFLLSVEAWARFTAEVARTHWWFGTCEEVRPESPVTLVEVLNVPQDPEARQYLAGLGLLPGSREERTLDPVPQNLGFQPPSVLPSAGSHKTQHCLCWSSIHSDTACSPQSSFTASRFQESSSEYVPLYPVFAPLFPLEPGPQAATEAHSPCSFLLGHLQEERSYVPSASQESPVSEASCFKASTSTPKRLSDPEVVTASEPENTGTPAITKKRKKGFQGVCRSILRFLQCTCCIRQAPDTGPSLHSRKVLLRSRKVLPEGSPRCR